MYAYLHVVLFFFNDTATTVIYTLSLHDALPISYGICTSISTSGRSDVGKNCFLTMPMPSTAMESAATTPPATSHLRRITRSESTRLNSSHTVISYAVFCLKKKNK